MRQALLILAGAGLFACGGPRRVTIQPIKTAEAPVVGPKASAEEAEGTVPPLKGLVKAIPLVPPELVPPEPPPDPEYAPE